MSGAVDGFTPNMSPEDVAELDRRRGLGDMGSLTDPEILVNKRPWLKPDGTHKSREKMDIAQSQVALQKAMKLPAGGMPFGKCSMGCDGPCEHTKKACDEGCTGDCDHEGKHPVEKAMANLEKYVISSAPPPGAPAMPKPKAPSAGPSAPKPGGPPPIPRDAKSVDGGDDDEEGEDISDKLFGKSPKGPSTAAGPSPSSQREHQRSSGKKERSIAMRYASRGKSAPETEDDDVKLIEDLLTHEKKEAKEDGKALEQIPYHGSASSPSEPKGAPNASSGATASGTLSAGPKATRQGTFKQDRLPKVVVKSPGKAQVHPDSGIGGGVSMPAPPPPPPPAPVTPSSTMKSFNSHSLYVPPPLGPYDPFGVLRSAMSRPIHHAAPVEPPFRSQEVLKSCVTHGLTFRASMGCTPCNIQKAQTCQNCGGGMLKSFGGELRCPRGH